MLIDRSLTSTTVAFSTGVTPRRLRAFAALADSFGS
jgi:hypothetical protein